MYATRTHLCFECELVVQSSTMSVQFRELVCQLPSLLAEVMSDDEYLLLTRKSKPGEPTTWVGANYPSGDWLIKEKMLVVPAIDGGGLLVGIVECDPEQTTVEANGVVSCKYIVDTQHQSSGPILVAGYQNNKETVLRVTGRESSLTQELSQFLGQELKSERATIYIDQSLDAFAGFLSIVLSQKNAFGIPLESSEELIEQTHARCLNYLYADMIVSSG